MSGRQLDRSRWDYLQHANGTPGSSIRGNIYIDDAAGLVYFRPIGGSWAQIESSWDVNGQVYSPGVTGARVELDLGTATSGNALVLESNAQVGQSGQDVGILFSFSDDSAVSRIYTGLGTDASSACLFLSGNGDSSIEVAPSIVSINNSSSSSTLNVRSTGGSSVINFNNAASTSASISVVHSTEIMTISADSDIYISARGGSTPFNDASNTSLDGSFTASSIMGAINELKADSPGLGYDSAQDALRISLVEQEKHVVEELADISSAPATTTVYYYFNVESYPYWSVSITGDSSLSVYARIGDADFIDVSSSLGTATGAASAASYTDEIVFPQEGEMFTELQLRVSTTASDAYKLYAMKDKM